MPTLAEVRDIIDRTSEGRGFLPLVLSGGMEHYQILKNVRPVSSLLTDFLTASGQKFYSRLTGGYLPPRRCMKIFSDIDDTVMANWIDVRAYSRYQWEAKTVYPGMRSVCR